VTTIEKMQYGIELAKKRAYLDSFMRAYLKGQVHEASGRKDHSSPFRKPPPPWDADGKRRPRKMTNEKE
jgi:hypothetical protein